MSNNPSTWSDHPLPAVIVLKLVLNQLKQAAMQKTRICVNGSVQIQGRDYEESYTPSLLAPSTKILIAVAYYLNWQLFHFDVHNAFQSTPNPGDIHGNRAYLKINREWLEFIKLHKPEWWDQVKNLLSKHSVDELPMEMCMFMQGRVNASLLMWAIEVEEFLSSTLKLVANRADPCVYSSIVNGEPVILGQATDDFLYACEKKTTYDYSIVAQFRRKWKIPALGIVRKFFGLNFVISTYCITIDQTDKCQKINTQVFGPSWILQLPKGMYTILMKAGSKYAELLARSPPLSDADLLATELSFSFNYRSILGACVHLAICTHLDILLACVCLAQFQTNTGHEHLEALKHLIGYLRRNPDIPLTYCRQRFDVSVSSLDIQINFLIRSTAKLYLLTLIMLAVLTSYPGKTTSSAWPPHQSLKPKKFTKFHLEPNVSKKSQCYLMNLPSIEMSLNSPNPSMTPLINFHSLLAYLAPLLLHTSETRSP
jgi:hypothetical protein